MDNSYNNIALFGGSFDPPHIGHEKIIFKVLDSLKIDKLIVMPTFLNPFKKQSFFTAIDRLNLVKQLFSNDKQIEVSDFEISQNKATPTITTVLYLKTKYKPKIIYLVIGSDNLESLHLWKDFENLKKMVTFVVISRDNYQKNISDISQIVDIKLDINISSTLLRKKLILDFIPKRIQSNVKKIMKDKLNG
jgi:nicotinate-nucleotide adenylyltransferase